MLSTLLLAALVAPHHAIDSASGPAYRIVASLSPDRAHLDARAVLQLRRSAFGGSDSVHLALGGPAYPRRRPPPADGGFERGPPPAPAGARDRDQRRVPHHHRHDPAPPARLRPLRLDRERRFVVPDIPPAPRRGAPFLQLRR